MAMINLVLGKNCAIVANSKDVSKGIFNPYLYANYVVFNPATDFRPVGGGQQAHPQYRNFFKEEIEKAKKVFDEERKLYAPVNDIIYHKKMDEILNALKENRCPYLVGPAGTGKSFTCEQIAKILGLDFYSQNAVSDASDLTGYTDAVGNFVEKAFYRAFKHGGLFLFDEIDASVPDALMCINNAIANGVMLFPNGEQVKAHSDFRIVLAGNTFGTGATAEYNTRSQLDGAFRDRLAFIRYGYDKRVENSIAKADKNILDFYYAYRNTIKKLGIVQIVSYRGLKALAHREFASIEEIIEQQFTKELGADAILQIYNNIGISNEYSEALMKVYNNVKEYEDEQ